MSMVSAGGGGHVAEVVLAREPTFQLGAMKVRPAAREIECLGQTQCLEPRVMQVLVFLARHRGSVISRQDLSEACWAGLVVGGDALTRCIYALRRLAETYAAFSITTVARVGYRLSEVAPERASDDLLDLS